MNTSQTGMGIFLLQTCCLRCLLPPRTPSVTQQRQPETVTLLLLATFLLLIYFITMPAPFCLLPLSTPPPHLHLQFTVSLHAPTLSHLNCTIPVDLVSSPPPLCPAPQVILHRVAKGTLQKRPSGFPHPKMGPNSMGPNSSKALLNWSLTPSSAPSFPAIHFALWVSVTLSSLMCLEGSWHSAHCLYSYLNTLLSSSHVYRRS